MKRDSDNLRVARQALLGIPLVLFPAACLLLSAPLMWGIWSGPPGGLNRLSGLHPLLWLLSAVIGGALVAAPGYFVAAFEEDRLVALSSAGAWWIRASLGMGGLASVVAAPLVLFFGRWLLVFPIGTLLGCAYLWWRSERLWRDREAT